MIGRALALVVVALLGGVAPCLADPCIETPEPDDRPRPDGPRLEGAGCWRGELEGADVDMVRWSPSAAPTGARVVLALEATPGAVVVAQVVRVGFADDGSLEEVEEVARVEVDRATGTGLAEVWVPPGEYQLAVLGAGAPSEYRLRVEARPATPAPGARLEPGRRVSLSLADEPVDLAFEGGGADHLWALRLARPWSPDRRHWRLALLAPDDDARVAVEASRGEELVLAPLAPGPGRHRLRVEGEPGPVEAELVDLGPRAPGGEREPNDADEDAVPAEVGFEHRGTWMAEDRDTWRLTVPSGRTHRYQLEARHEGGGDFYLYLYRRDAAGRRELFERRGPVVHVPDLALEPGEYLVVTTLTTPGPYTWRLRPQRGRPPTGWEHEPNDALETAVDLGATRMARGELVGDELDLVRFDPGEPVQRWNLQVTGDAVQQVRLLGPDRHPLKVVRRAIPGPLAMDGVVLHPGMHWLELSGADAPWSLRALAAGPVPPGFEREPNDAGVDATNLTPGQAVRGAVESTDDRDYFRLGGDVAGGMRVRLEAPPGARLWLSLIAGVAEARSPEWSVEVGDEPVTKRVYLEAGESLLGVAAEIPSRLEYTLRVDPEPGMARPPPGSPPGEAAPESPVELRLALPEAPAQAYAAAAQVRAGVLALRNPGAEVLRLRFRAGTDHHLWALAAPTPRELAPGEVAEVPVELRVEPGAWADWPVTAWVVAEDQAGGRRHAVARQEAVGEGPPEDPGPGAGVPEALRGGLDLASLALGARLAPDQDASGARLFDGRAGLGAEGEVPAEVVVQLADPRAPVAGFVFHPLAACDPTGRPTRVAVDLEVEEGTFALAWEGSLEAAPRAQAVTLEEARPARAARLRILETRDGGAPCLGAFRVIAAPGSFPGERNLLAPALGGSVVQASPGFASAWNSGWILEGPEAAVSDYLREGEDPQVVLAFGHQRAARLARLEWVHGPPEDRPEYAVRAAQVEVSEDGPLGPWRELGEWDLARARGPVATLEFPRPVWARALRLGFPSHAGSAYQAPATLRAIEAPEDAGYRSVLGQWGEGSAAGPYEQGRAAGDPNQEGASTVVPAHASRATALALPAAPSHRFAGEVQVGVREAWVRLEVPAGMDELALDLSTPDAALPLLELRDAAGAPLAPAEEHRESARGEARARWKVAGEVVYLRVHEPRRSIVIAWDTSASVAPYRRAIWRSVLRFSAGVHPDREVAGLLPFGSAGLLGGGWVDTPEDLRARLGTAASGYDSSEAEGALRTAAELLAKREGRRVVVMLTDAECTYDADLWPALEAVRPQVFMLWVPSFGYAGAELPFLARGLAQAWPQVNRGRFYELRSHGGIERALDRALFEVRSPVRFQARARFRRAAPPAPGALRVARAGGARRSRPALGVIFDASGSMYKPLGDATRIGVAREVLTELVDEALPEGVDVALRVFGHREERSCRTDLERSLAPLDRDALKAAVAAIDPKPFSRTPLGASLEAMVGDLREATGPRMVVLLTDGEETCDGDPEAALAALRAAGVHTRVNIVGLAIDAAETKRTFARWAELGGGQYFDAADAGGLAEAVTRATRAPFRVLDAAGGEVARGEVGGEPVTLSPGRYILEVPGESLPRRPVVVAEATTALVEL